MQQTWEDIRQLSDLLEEEAAGRVIDRARAAALAAELADRHPMIRASLALIRQRMNCGGGQVSGTA